MVKPLQKIHIAYEDRYEGPHANGQIYEPMMLPNCEKALIHARATARFDGGREIVLLIHATQITRPAYDWAIKNLGQQHEDQLRYQVVGNI